MKKSIVTLSGLVLAFGLTSPGWAELRAGVGTGTRINFEAVP